MAPLAAPLLLLSCLGLSAPPPSPLPPPPPDSRVDASTLRGKLLFGYQGWFDCPESGAPGATWVHWSTGITPNATNSTFDLWPAVDELPARSRHETPELTSRSYPGRPLELFSSFPNSTADVHFRWMREYGLDGVFIQRFVHGLSGFRGREKDAVLTHALRAAEANGRVVSVMYDISGAKENEWAGLILKDWKHLLNDLRVTSSPAFLHHAGKPVLSIWGIGHVSHPGTPASSATLLAELRAITPITFVGGVSTHWREGSGDAKPGFDSVYKSMDVLSPWLVGRTKDNASFDSYMANTFVADLDRTHELGVGWAPVIFPGFSWSNLMRTRGTGPAKFNAIPRRAGRFWSHQAAAFAAMRASNASAGPNANTSVPLFYYGAMFDELDEGEIPCCACTPQLRVRVQLVQNLTMNMLFQTRHSNAEGGVTP